MNTSFNNWLAPVMRRHQALAVQRRAEECITLLWPRHRAPCHKDPRVSAAPPPKVHWLQPRRYKLTHSHSSSDSSPSGIKMLTAVSWHYTLHSALCSFIAWCHPGLRPGRRPHYGSGSSGGWQGSVTLSVIRRLSSSPRLGQDVIGTGMFLTLLMTLRGACHGDNWLQPR